MSYFVHEKHGNGFLKKVTTCLCTSRSTVTSNKGIDKSVDGSPFCQAVDAMFGRVGVASHQLLSPKSSNRSYCLIFRFKIVACCNTVSKPQMHRPSVRIPFMYMCELHRHRLRLHQCCPGCGLFCTEVWLDLLLKSSLYFLANVRERFLCNLDVSQTYLRAEIYLPLAPVNNQSDASKIAHR